MTYHRVNKDQLAVVANQKVKEKEFWLETFSGDLEKTTFPYDFNRIDDNDYSPDILTYKLDDPVFSKLMHISNGSDQTLHVLLSTALMVLLNKYSGSKDIVLGTAIYKQDGKSNDFINTILPLRSRLHDQSTFRNLLMDVRQTVMNSVQNQNYPIEILLDELNLPFAANDFPLFDVVLIMENIHDKQYIEHINPGLLFSFLRTTSDIEVCVHYNSLLYKKNTIQGIVSNYVIILEKVLSNTDVPLQKIDMLSDETKNRLLVDFNRLTMDYPRHKTIHSLFEDQVEKDPENTAVIFQDQKLSYRQLNEKANQLARVLNKTGVQPETVVGIMTEPSLDMTAYLMAILKSGGAYLPIDPGLPIKRVQHMLNDSGAGILVTDKKSSAGTEFSTLLNLDTDHQPSIVVTDHRSHIKEFNTLPVPDRSLVDLGKYKNKIGMASVSNSISLQTTRGCPYKCLFCHKVWSKHHVYRSAENLFNEVEYFYKNGVTKFSLIDDCFNLNKENSARFFKHVVKNKMDIELFFPNGLRGDIMTPDYIDLMVEAGCKEINLSLETASPRLQKLIKKDLNIDKFKRAMEYIAGTHPGVLLEIAAMHGFPTETEEEAMMTLNFIKDIKWIHFPYIHILKIFPNTEMEELALANGVSKEDIFASKDLAYHELPETLPFAKSFTRKFQADLMNNYFLNQERLKQVLPVQIDIMDENALIDKYNAYLPIEINRVEDIPHFSSIPKPARVETHDLKQDSSVTLFERAPAARVAIPGAKKIVMLDLSQHFSSHSMLYNVSEQPLGLISLLTYLKQQFGDTVDGRIYKAGIDFDSYEELNSLLDQFKPDLVGIRSLTFYSQFFHETVSLLRQWGIVAPIIAGGPYATSDYPTVLKDRNVDLVIIGEGEYTLAELVGKMFENHFKMPDTDTLKRINGIAFAETSDTAPVSRAVLLTDYLDQRLQMEDPRNPRHNLSGNNLAYVMYTSGSTGKPKGVMVEHRQVNNCIFWMQDKFALKAGDIVVQRTNLTFDPSVWEIFWPLYLGGGVKVLTTSQRKDAEYLIRLMAMSEGSDITAMYCPASLVKAICEVMSIKTPKPRLTLPWFIIGAEPISRETVNTFYSFYSGRIVNTYGPTECTINNTFYELETGDINPIVPIGKPVANNQLYILSPQQQLVPLKQTGEICIAGESVARGYINNDLKTKENFIQNPFGRGRLYKTGDIGRWHDDGNIEILGRVDEQVKIRGYRIELGEIENALAAHPHISNNIVVTKQSIEANIQVKTCKLCGITSTYPGVIIDNDNICHICNNFDNYRIPLNNYFKNLDNLKDEIKKVNKNSNSKYDCLLLYSGGRGAAYALYKLVGLGLNVLAATYDNGYFGKSDLKNIRMITDSLNVDHIVLTHKNSDKIMAQSMEIANTVCRGCFHTSSSLAAQYAYQHNIPAIIGATLSRGQIIENKVFMFLQEGITDVGELEAEAATLRKNTQAIDKNIFDLIDIDEIKKDDLPAKVKAMDFFRYCDVTNQDMINYLNKKNPYWKTRKNYAVYSTNCPIKQIGDYAHLHEKGIHYYGSATSWEKRLRHITMENYKQDLTCVATAQGYLGLSKRMGFQIPEKEKEENQLCAYIVTDSQQDTSDLRDFLSQHIPEYMIPSWFVPMKELPLTHNGKIDKKKLPLPATNRSEKNYEAPRNEVEEILASVWKDVLRIEKIGINDDFFNVGGDSIKAIQIAARMHPLGKKVELSDLFSNTTIKKLGPFVHTISNQIPQGIVEGHVPLTPIQAYFFEHHINDNHYHNLNVMIYREEGFNPEILQEVFTKVSHHHDALRMVFKKEDGNIIQTNRGEDANLFDFKVINIKEDQITQAAVEIQSAIDLENGPLVKTALFKTKNGDHCFIAVHHLVADAISSRILLEDIATGYMQAMEGIEVEFQRKTDSYKEWSNQLSQYAQTPEALSELDYWHTLCQIKVDPLPVDQDVPYNAKIFRNNRIVHISLETQKTEKLIKHVNRKYSTEINDILLLALAMALEEWGGTKCIRIYLEGHGREGIIKDVNITRTVGWYTSQFPVVLDISQSGQIPERIESIKRSNKQIPNKGIGYSILKYLTPPEKKEGFDLDMVPEIRFNYMGQFDLEPNDGLFKVSNISTGDPSSPNTEIPYLFNIVSFVANGELALAFAYNKFQYERNRVQALADSFMANLTKIIEHCTNK